MSIAEVLLEKGDISGAEQYVGDAAALIQVTESRYDATHERMLRALLAYAQDQPQEMLKRSIEARQAAEAQAYASFHFYAMALEARARVAVGEHHTGILIATTALGAIDALQGSEYSLQIRAVCCDALERAGSPQAREMRNRASSFAQRCAANIVDPQLRQAYMKRPPVVELLRERVGGAR